MYNDIIKLLNLKESEIEEIDSIMKDEKMIIHLKLKRKIEKCPHCQSHLQRVKDYKIRDINHPILNNMKCIIRYKCRRYECQNCFSTFNESNSFVDFRQRNTNYLVKVVMDSLTNKSETFQTIADRCNISNTEAESIFDTHYYAKTGELPEVLSIDEVHDPATGVGVYDCVLLDFINNKIIDYLPDRSYAYLSNYFTKKKKKELKNVKFVSIDMWDPYRKLAKKYFKGAVICVDSFHVIENINRAFDKIRIRITSQFDKKSDEYYLLKKFAFLLRKRRINIPESNPRYNRKLHKELNLHEILDLQLETNEELKKAYYIKELYLYFNQNTELKDAPEELCGMIKSFQDSEIEEYISVYKMLLNWFDEIVNSFTILSNGERINNGKIESRNKDIKKILYNANGVTNPSRLRARVMYVINKDTYSITAIKNENKSQGKKRGNYIKK